MKSPVVTVWNIDIARQFSRALLTINDEKTMQAFLRDVMTEKEIIEIGSRLEAARLLDSGATYMNVIRKTKLSSTTVARISDWLQGGCGGYAKVLANLESHHSHTPPARAK